MGKTNKYYSLVVNDREADVYIFGDIVEDWTKEWWGFESDVSSLSLVNEVKDLDVDVINVHINSYGGIVSEGLAIYNTLKNHKAKVRTIVDGFALFRSLPVVLYGRGRAAFMNDASLLMIHNAWTRAEGNADWLRKVADDLEKITQGSIEAYMARVNISEEKVKKSCWMLKPGFCRAKPWNGVLQPGLFRRPETNKAAASARKLLYSIVSGQEGNQESGIPADLNADEIVDKLYNRLIEGLGKPARNQYPKRTNLINCWRRYAANLLGGIKLRNIDA